MSIVADMEASVVADGFDPVYVRNLQEHQLAEGLDRQPLGHLRPRRKVRQLILRTIKRTQETRIIERFQEIVESASLESAQRILIVSRHEDDGRRQLASQQLQYIKPVTTWHLHVEK